MSRSSRPRPDPARAATPPVASPSGRRRAPRLRGSFGCTTPARVAAEAPRPHTFSIGIFILRRFVYVAHRSTRYRSVRRVFVRWRGRVGGPARVSHSLCAPVSGRPARPVTGRVSGGGGAAAGGGRRGGARGPAVSCAVPRAVRHRAPAAARAMRWPIPMPQVQPGRGASRPVACRAVRRGRAVRRVFPDRDPCGGPALRSRHRLRRAAGVLSWHRSHRFTHAAPRAGAG